jgi:hypothetical protein
MMRYLSGGPGVRILLCGCVLAFYALTLAQPITLVSADLGRHLKNGEIFVRTFSVPQGNYYSYTNPDFPFVNHHWGTGVVFYLIERLAGFDGLHVFSIAIGVATLAIFFAVAVAGGGFTATLLVSVLAAPLAASRAEVRPEAFSYFFAGFFFWVVWNYLEGRMTRRWLWALPPLMALWINLHVYFFFGFALMGLGIAEAAYRLLIQKRRDAGPRLRSLVVAGAVSCVAVFVNPAGLRGVLYPLTIFNNYGYRLLENQSVWFLDRVVGYPPSLYFKILFAALVAACGLYVARVARGREKLSLLPLVLAAGMSVIAWTAVRNFALFAYFAIPLIAIFCREDDTRNDLFSRRRAAVLSAAGILFVALFIVNPSFWDRYKAGGWGIGLRADATGVRNGAGAAEAADFVRREGIRGPVFNNYDIGGYLIYYLFPRERIFVDNRPEAYPASFFADVYIPMQEREDIWREQAARFNFEAVIFYWHDLTPWAQEFLGRRVSDPSWPAVYADGDIVIFARRGGVNQSVIDKYEIPRSAFQFTSG